MNRMPKLSLETGIMRDSIILSPTRRLLEKKANQEAGGKSN